MRIGKHLFFWQWQLTLAGLPLYVVRAKLGLPTTFLEILLVLLFLHWVARKWIQRDFRLRTGTFFLVALTIGASASLALVVGGILSGDWHHALGIWKAYFAEPILFYLVSFDFFASEKEQGVTRGVFELAQPLFISGTLMAVLGLTQALLGLFVFTVHQADRAHALFNNGNALALYLGPILLLLGLFLILGKRNTNERAFFWLYSFFFALQLGAFILTKSSGGLIALLLSAVLCGLAVYLWRRQPQLLTKLWLASLLVTVMVSLLMLGSVDRWAPHKLNPWLRGESTWEIRLCLWQGTKNLLRKHPFSGAGLSGFKELYKTRYYTCDAEPLEYPHQIYLNFWSELGLLGLFAFLWLFWRFFGLGGVERAGREAGLYAIGVKTAMFYWIIHGLVDAPYFKNDLSVEFFWLVLLMDLFYSVSSGGTKETLISFLLSLPASSTALIKSLFSPFSKR